MTVTVRTEEPPAFVELRETFARRTQTDARDWYLVFKARYGMREVFASLRDAHGEGKVLTTLFTGCTAVDSIIAGGLAPDYAPLDRDSLEMDPDAVELADDVRAVLLQHSYGVVQQDVCLRLREAAHAVGALFVEDSAHCLLRMARDAEGAPLADISIHSFGIEKTFSDIYFGGAIWVNPALRALDPEAWDCITRALDGLPALPARLDQNTQAYHSQVRLMVHLPGSLGTRMRERKLARGTYEPPVAEVERRGGLPYESYRPSAWIVDRIRTAIARLDDNEAQRLACGRQYAEGLEQTDRLYLPARAREVAAAQPLIRYPVLLPSEGEADELLQDLRANGFYAVYWYRMPFFPGASSLEAYGTSEADPRYQGFRRDYQGVVGLPTDIDPAKVQQVIEIVEAHTA